MFSTFSGRRSNCHVPSFSVHAFWVNAKHQNQFVEAVRKEDLKSLFKVLKKKDIDVNFMFRFDMWPYMEKMSALHYAAKYGKIQMIQLLLENKQVQIDLKTQFDEATALHYVCDMRGKPNDMETFAIAEALVQSGADVNLEDHWGKSPLIWAAETGNLSVTRLLLQSGANVNHAYRCDELPSSASRSLVCDMLTCDPYKGNSALIQASRFLHTEIVRELLLYGADVNIVNTNHSNALHAAADMYSLQRGRSGIVYRSNDPSIVTLLVEAAGDVTIMDINGNTPLMRSLLSLYEMHALLVPTTAKSQGYVAALKIAQLLITAGCPVNGHALDTNELTILSRLLSAGAFLVKSCSTDVIHEFTKLVQLLVLAGSLLTQENVESANNLSMHDLTEFLSYYAGAPLPLKFLSVQMIRKSVCRYPLERHLQLLQLPERLKQLVCLRIY